MNHQLSFMSQRVDSRDSNDNAPPRYSAPSSHFKVLLSGYANPHCSRCRGTGYIGAFKHVCAGRCFKCIPEAVWERVLEQFNQVPRVITRSDEMIEIFRAVFSDDADGAAAYLSDGIWITAEGLIDDAEGR